MFAIFTYIQSKAASDASRHQPMQISTAAQHHSSYKWAKVCWAIAAAKWCKVFGKPETRQMPERVISVFWEDWSICGTRLIFSPSGKQAMNEVPCIGYIQQLKSNLCTFYVLSSMAQRKGRFFITTGKQIASLQKSNDALHSSLQKYMEMFSRASKGKNIHFDMKTAILGNTSYVQDSNPRDLGRNSPLCQCHPGSSYPSAHFSQKPRGPMQVSSRWRA